MVIAPLPVRAGEPEFEPPRLYGILAEFGTAEQLLRATRRAYAAGFRTMDAYAPFPVEGLSDALGFHPKALSLFFGLLLLNGHPEPYHPVFNVEAFARASRDRFFLCIEARDPRFDPESTRRFLQELGAREVADVPA